MISSPMASRPTTPCRQAHRADPRIAVVQVSHETCTASKRAAGVHEYACGLAGTELGCPLQVNAIRQPGCIDAIEFQTTWPNAPIFSIA